MFVFATTNPRKLALNVTIPNIDFLEVEKFTLEVDSINCITQEKLPEGSIQDIGIVNDVHVYVYKFSKMKCSNPTSSDVCKVPIKSKYISQFPTSEHRMVFLFTCRGSRF